MLAADALGAEAGEAIAMAAESVRQARATSNEEERTRLVGDALGALAAEPGIASWSWLREPLQSSPPDLAGAQARFDAAAEALRIRTSPTDSRREREVLTEVLADRRFHPGDWHDLVPGWLLPAALIIEKLLEFVWNIVRWPFDRMLDLLGNLLRSPIMALLGLATTIAIVLLYRTAVRAAIVRQAEIARPHELLPVTAVEALMAAQREATLGHYREASHFVLLSTLLWVEEHEAARFDPSATNREHLRRAQATARPAVGRALAPLVTAFDNLWYGTGAVSEADYRSLLDLAARVRETAA
jgi:hypothetical protein